MLITKLELYRFKRFALNLDGLFVLEPKHLNILTWGNGSGKSSLLSQLTPFPPDFKKEYYEDGYKIITIEYGNSNYVLRTDKHGHSFIKDNIELNDGSTKRVQIELIEHHFSLSPNILPLLYGSNNFTNLSPLDRKNFLTKISTIDFNYSLSIFAKLLELKKESITLLKHFKEEIVILSKNKIDKEQEKDIRMDLACLEKFKEVVYGSFYNDIGTYDINSILSNYQRLDKEIKHYETLPEFKKEEKDTLVKHIETLKNEEKKLEEELSNVEKSIDKEYNTELNKAIEFVKNKLENLIPNLKEDPFVVSNNLDGLNNHIKLYLNTLDNLGNDILSLTQEQVEDMNNQLLELLSISNLSTFLKDQKTKLKCGKCSTPLELTFNQPDDNKIIDFKNKIKLYKIYENDTNKIISIIESNPSYYLLKDFKLTRDNISSFYNVLLVLISKLDSYKEYYVKLEKLNNELKRFEILTDLTKANKQEKIDTLKNKVKLVEITRKQLEQKLEEVNKVEMLYSNFENIITEIEETNKEMSEYRNSIYKTLYNNTLNLLIGRINSVMVKYKEILTNVETIDNQIKDLNTKIENKTKSLRSIDILINVLNPNTGLIAKSIKSFLGYILDDVNSIINSVWTYPIEVVLDLDEVTTLSYKFKVIVNNNRDNVIEDISKLSSGMQEIVNLAFRIVFIKTINSKIELPLFLDEFGKSMDMEHRINCYNLIDKLLNNFKQIYLVSHFESMHGRFTHAYFPELK